MDLNNIKFPETNFEKEGKNYEGFWQSSDTPTYPTPESNETYSQSEIIQAFIIKLGQVEEASLKSSRRDRELMPLFYFKHSNKREREYNFNDYELNESFYLGYSKCRICDENNGSSEFELTIKSNNDIWVWPQGLVHYYKTHSVIPSRAFYDMIMELPIPRLRTPEEKVPTSEDLEMYARMDKLAKYKNMLAMMEGMKGIRFCN
jgi:hypothetical protein